METGIEKISDPKLKSKPKSKSRSYNRRILLRGNKESAQPLSMVVNYLDDLPVKCNIEQLVKEFLVHRYLPLALKNKEGLEADSKLLAYESIRFFQGVIDSIKEAFDIQDKPATPVVSLVIQGADVHVQEEGSLEDVEMLRKGSPLYNGNGHLGNGYPNNGYSGNGYPGNEPSNGVNQAQSLLGLYKKGDV